MKPFEHREVWFVTGSQHLYGPEALRQVAAHARQVAGGLNEAPQIPVEVVCKDIVTRPNEILAVCQAANAAPECVGLICWMHTFSPAKMWIAGLEALQRPFMHLHTQFEADLPWADIDMDFMNLNQSAHGGREFGFIGTRLRRERKVVVGHWQEEEVRDRVGAWVRAACGWRACQTMKVARFGDNMREVAVTEGDKVAAQIQLGVSVSGFGIGDLTARIGQVTDPQVDALVAEYRDTYQVAAAVLADQGVTERLRCEARIEAGLRAFLEEGGFTAYTDTFEDLHGLPQLPGLATQRLMAAGFGFGAEGDWKTAALLRAMKVMAAGLEGGTSFMEDYTYHLEPGRARVLGAHMLEVCPSIAAARPSLEVHPLGIGGKGDPVRLVFTAPPGPALNATLIDLGNRFRMVVNEVDAVAPDADLPHLPVARALWVPRPDLKVGAAAWILAGGTHHTAFSQALGVEPLEDFAEMAGIELVVIDGRTRIRDFKDQLRWNEVYYHLARGF
ncbi:MAG: L-arabinose isomerase [Gemmatimonadota bacterium]